MLASSASAARPQTHVRGACARWPATERHASPVPEMCPCWSFGSRFRGHCEGDRPAPRPHERHPTLDGQRSRAASSSFDALISATPSRPERSSLFMSAADRQYAPPAPRVKVPIGRPSTAHGKAPDGIVPLPACVPCSVRDVVVPGAADCLADDHDVCRRRREARLRVGAGDVADNAHALLAGISQEVQPGVP